MRRRASGGGATGEVLPDAAPTTSAEPSVTGASYPASFWLSAALVATAYVAPLVILGEASHVLIHDNLDGPVPSARLLADSGAQLAPGDTPLGQLFNGLPRAYLGSEFNVLVWLFAFLAPFSAYVINIAIIHIVAFVGMYRLLSTHIVPLDRRFIIVGVSLCYALVPFWPMAGLSVAALPLVLSAFLSIRARRQAWVDWAIIITVPFYSSLILTFGFFLLALFLFWVYESIARRRIDVLYVAALVLMSAIFVAIEYRLVGLMIFESGSPHRVEFSFSSPNPVQTLIIGIREFFRGQVHAYSYTELFVLPAAVFASWLVLRGRVREPRVLALLVISIGISIWYALWPWVRASDVATSLSLYTVNLSRFHWLHPLVWYVLFALSLVVIARHFRRIGAFLVVALISLQGVYLFMQHDQFGLRPELSSPQPTYGEFYAAGLFDDIEASIGRPKEDYSIISVGMHPGIALYNGFSTLDGYLPNYPLSYKHDFRPIIAAELDKNERQRSYFDNWGSRVYVLASELDGRFMEVKERAGQIQDLELDTQALKAMGGGFVFSAVTIVGAEDAGLRLRGVYSRPDAAWRISVYEVL